MGSSPRKRKYKDEVVAAGRTGGDSKAATLDLLEWDKFEFGDSPKWDARFGNNTIASNDEQLDVLAEEETRQDRQMTARLDQEFAAWQTLDPELVQRATSALLPLVKPERVDKIRSVLGRRTSNVRFVYENPSNPSNVWACLRTIDSFGIQHVDVIVQSGKYKGKAAITQKRGMRTALGSAQWLTLRNHLSTEDAIAYIRRQRRKDGGGGEGGGPGFRIYASDVNPTARDIRTIDWNEEAAGGPICIVMGNEESGISDEMRKLVDDTFYLPMAGFAESFNLSVATAVTLAYLNAAIGDADSQSSDGAGGGAARGPIRPGDLSQRELDCLVLKGMLSSVANKKAIHAFLKREGIVLPEEIRLL
jgi:tRNA G18 (ribose-2'-O)-methylase SpoU